MATEKTHKQEFRIRDLSTRSVLLFPTRAQVIRDIKDISIQPGANQIVIDGLAPTVDEHSIKVEGTGAATITDVVVNLLPNRELFEDVYPSDDDDEDDEDSDESEAEQEAMVTISDKIKDLNIKLLAENEKINSAAYRLKVVDLYGIRGAAATEKKPVDLEKLVGDYNQERQKIYQDHESSTLAADNIRSQISETEKEKTKLAKSWVKSNEKKEKEKAKRREKRLRKKAEISKEKQRIKIEREGFWAKQVYRVTINLEPTTDTPLSSRRSSTSETITSLTPATNLATSTFHEDADNGKPLPKDKINLSISYITSSASWSPRYDLSLSTSKLAGLLEYGAELKNTTSETWRDAKFILSTSQTSFSGLSETIPILEPWQVRLQKGRRQDGGLMSSYEVAAKRKEWSKVADSEKPRWQIFGQSARDQDVRAEEQSEWARKKKRVESANKYMSSHERPIPQAFGSVPTADAEMYDAASPGYSPASVAHKRRGMGSFQQRRMAVTAEAREECEDDDEAMGFGLFDDGPPSNALNFEAGAWEETGLTTTYDVPGTKTLAPSNSASKHKIAKISFNNIIFSHIVIGKLRQVAFLKARLRNSSKITLLKGPLGLTLDGSFLGQSSFPRCSVGESFSLPLGVDPSLSVSYGKPTVRRSQSGIFSKEDSNFFTRTITIQNTQHNATPVDLTVLDQVPVSEDERLRIEIVTPEGLKIGGASVKTGADALVPRVGAGGKGVSKDVRASVYGDTKAKWGSALATAKKGGEVVWNVKLNPGQGVKLILEYEAAFPAGEGVVGVVGGQ